MKQGMQIFNEKAGCAACHVLKHAGSQGNIGPNLDMSKDSQNVAYVKDMVQNGLGVMPAFGEDGILTPEEVDIVSKYCLLYTSPSPRDLSTSRMPSSA